MHKMNGPQRAMAKTEIIDLQLGPEMLGDPAKCEALIAAIGQVLESFGLVEKSRTNLGSDVLIISTTPKGSHAILRTYSKGLVTLSIEEGQSDKPEFGEAKVDELLRKAREVCNDGKKIVRLFNVKRGLPIDVYAMTTDKRIVEYDFDQLLFEDRSNYQHVRLVHSKSFGNMLWLDNLQNLAEEDILYTHSLMNKGRERYEGKEVLILGGGDGALLHELLKENPKFVTMVDIDKMVMDQCKVHLRSACGDVLDNYESSNYKIIVDDALKVMATYVSEGRTFDFIFNDLTDVPVTIDPVDVVWTLIDKILKLAIPLLKENAKYYNHATNYNVVSSLKMYEQLLESMSLTYRKYDAHVPSFMERWVFYEVQKKKPAVV